jgi:hypothetical protein
LTAAVCACQDIAPMLALLLLLLLQVPVGVSDC